MQKRQNFIWCLFVFGGCILLLAALTPEEEYAQFLEVIRSQKEEVKELRRQVNALNSERADVPQICNGRLTLTSGTPVTVSDVTSASTIYFTPYKGRQIALYTGTAWKMYTFSQISIDISSTSGTSNYDIFAYDNSGTVALELSSAWSSDSTRWDTLSRQNGVWVKDAAKTRRYLGSFRTTMGSPVTDDAYYHRYLWNNCNRVTRTVRYTDSGNTWSYNMGNGFNFANGQTTSMPEVMVGLQEQVFRYFTMSLCRGGDFNPTFYTCGAGAAYGTNTGFPFNFASLYGSRPTHGTAYYQSQAEYNQLMQEGWNYLWWMEMDDGQNSYMGDNNSPTLYQAGMIVEFEQ